MISCSVLPCQTTGNGGLRPNCRFSRGVPPTRPQGKCSKKAPRAKHTRGLRRSAGYKRDARREQRGADKTKAPHAKHVPGLRRSAGYKRDARREQRGADKTKAPHAKHVPGLRRSAGNQRDARCGRKKPAAAGERGHGKTTRVCRRSKKQEKPFILFLQAFQEQQMTQRFPCGDNLQALDQHPQCTGSAVK